MTRGMLGLRTLAIVGGLAAAGDAIAAAPTRILLGPSVTAPSPTSVLVWWHVDAESADHLVEYGTTESLGKTAQWTPPAPQRPEDAAVTSTEFPVVELKELESGKPIHYRVRSGKAASPLATFELPDPTRPFRVVFWGANEGGFETFARQTIPAIEKQKPNFLFVLGDMVELGFRSNDWKRDFYGPAARLLQSIPWYAVRGSHDGVFPLALRMLPLPGNNHWYAVTYGPIRWIVLDSNLQYRAGTLQARWLERELSSEESRCAAFRVVAIHHGPFHTVYRARGESGSDVGRSVLVPLLETKGVDLVVSGRSHVYERGSRARLDDGRTYYLVTGGGGGELHTLKTADWAHIHITQREHHIVVADVDEKAIRVKAIDTKTEKPLDEFVVPARPRGPAAAAATEDAP